MIEAARELREQLIEGEFPANAAAVLGEIFSARKTRDDSLLAESAEAWTEVLREAATARADFPDLAPGEWWELVLTQFGDSLRFDDRPAGALDLLGWLELLWEDAPHLVVAGLNDGRVPEAVTGDAFLPEALRARLGLKTNEARFARDAYQLAALAASRPAGTGRLDLLVGKVSAAGDPLRPSRLLLLCADAELPARVAALFRPVELESSTLPWQRAWRLTPANGAAAGAGFGDGVPRLPLLSVSILPEARFEGGDRGSVQKRAGRAGFRHSLPCRAGGHGLGAGPARLYGRSAAAGISDPTFGSPRPRKVRRGNDVAPDRPVGIRAAAPVTRGGNPSG